MKISTKGRYGLRAFIDLATYGVNEPVSISSISVRQNISEGYLEQLMAKLKKAGLVKSIRGASGGYMLAKDISEVSVGDVLRALEGDIETVSCLSMHDEACAHEQNCKAKYVWKKINDSLTATIDGIMIDTLINDSTIKNTEELDDE